MRTDSNRELARQLGTSETAVRRAEKAGRIKRGPDDSWGPAKVKAAWSDNTDPAQQRGAPSTGNGSRRAARHAVKPMPEAALGAVLERQGRDPLAPLQDVINDEGDIVVPVDPRYLGFWLTGLFGDPDTTDNLDGSWDHLRQVLLNASKNGSGLSAAGTSSRADVIGIDIDPALRIGATRGCNLAVLSELLPAAEAGLVEALSSDRVRDQRAW